MELKVLVYICNTGNMLMQTNTYVLRRKLATVVTRGKANVHIKFILRNDVRITGKCTLASLAT